MDQEMGMMSGWTRSQLNIELSSAQISLGKASYSTVSLFGFLLSVSSCKGRTICNVWDGSDVLGNKNVQPKNNVLYISRFKKLF